MTKWTILIPMAKHYTTTDESLFVGVISAGVNSYHPDPDLQLQEAESFYNTGKSHPWSN